MCPVCACALCLVGGDTLAHGEGDNLPTSTPAFAWSDACLAFTLSACTLPFLYPVCLYPALPIPCCALPVCLYPVCLQPALSVP